MRNKEYAGALRAQDGYLMLMTLRHAEQVVPASELEAPAGRELDPKERGMAEQLVAALEDRFDPAAHHDQYRARVLELVQSKAAGRPLKLKPAAAPRPPSRSLAAVLEASLAAVKEQSRGG
jgi:DNA end-binding protein Ku